MSVILWSASSQQQPGEVRTQCLLSMKAETQNMMTISPAWVPPAPCSAPLPLDPFRLVQRITQEISTSINTTKSCEVPRYLSNISWSLVLMTSLLLIVGNTEILYGRNSPPVCVTLRHGGVDSTKTKHTTQIKLFNYWMLCRQLKPMRSQEIKWDSMAAAFNVQFTLSHF